jgi:hypothetical protein
MHAVHTSVFGFPQKTSRVRSIPPFVYGLGTTIVSVDVSVIVLFVRHNCQKRNQNSAKTKNDQQK